MLRMRMKVIKEAIEYKNLPTSVEIFIGEKKIIANNLYLVTDPCGPYVHKHGGAIAIVTMASDMKTGLIIKDQFFDKVPKYVQKFVIYHEIGHFMNGDINSNNAEYIKRKNILRMFGISNDMEFKADSFASDHIGVNKCINALIWMMREVDLGIISKIEIKQRIHRLLNANKK